MLQDLLKEGFYWIHLKNRDQLRKNHPLRYLFWECTLNCNFFCEHCGSSAGRKVYNNELSTEEIKSVFKNIGEKFNPKKITIAVTGGEPLLRKDLFEVMSYAKELGFGWGMVTNGYLLDKKMAKKLKESGMSTVVVSIDGTQKTHDEFRKMPEAYDRALKAIENLAELNFVEDIQITTTCTKKNVGELEEMYSVFSKLPIHSWRVMNVDPIGRASGNKEILLSDKETKQMLDFIEKKRNAKGPRVTYDCTGYLGSYEGKLRGHFFQCLTGITVGSILHNGDIFVCPNVPRLPHLIQGNVKKDSFPEVWDSKFKIFRDKNRTRCEKCEKCNSWEECLGNGFHLWDFEKGEPKICHLEIIGEKD